MSRLEKDAQGMRQRIDELNGMLIDVGAEGNAALPQRAALSAPDSGLAAQREQLAEDLKQARDAAQARLQDAVTSLETIRLDLLRMHAGSGSPTSVTANLSKARELSDDIARLLEGQEEVERALKQIDAEG